MGRPARYTQRSGGSVTPLQPSSMELKQDNVIPDSKRCLAGNSDDGRRRNTENASMRTGPRYDLPTLLGIGSRVDTKNYPQKEELLLETRVGSVGRGYTRSSSGSVLGERVMNRRKLTSSTSDSIDSESQPSRAANFQYPIRQPINAPQGVLAQSNAGFARFLKQHSSPKHHRVTAGGRIVQMEIRKTPAPEFKLPSKEQERPDYFKHGDSVKELRASQPATDQRTKTERRNTNNPRNPSLESKSSGSDSLQTPVLATSDTSGISQHQEVSSRHLSTSSGVGSLSENQTVPPQFRGNQPQLSAKACPFTPFNTATEDRKEPQSSTELQYYSQVPIPQYMADASSLPIQTAYPATLNNTLGIYPQPMGHTEAIQFYPVNNPLSLPWMNQNQTFPAGAQPLAGGFHNPAGNKTLEEASQEYDNISGQLSNLDKYMAIHTWEIDAQSKKALVEQRIDLVRKLDAARMVKEHLESLPQPAKHSALWDGPPTEQASQQYFQGVSPGVQGAIYVPGNGMIQGGIMSSGMSFQQPHSSESIFATQIGGPQCGNLDMTNTNYGNYPTNYGINHQQAPINVPNASLGMATGNNQDGFVDEFERNKEDSTASSQRGLSRAERMAPSAISNVHRKIEEAANRGESLDPYVKELARVVAQLDNYAPTQNHNTVTIQQLHRQQQLKQKQEEAAITRENGRDMQVDRRIAAMSQNQIDCGQSSYGERSTMPQQNQQTRSAAQLRLEMLQGDRYRKDPGAVRGNMVHHHENIDPNKGKGVYGRAEPAQSYGAGLGESSLVADRQNKAEESRQRGSFFSALSFAPWRKRWYGNAAQKAGTSAQAQRINVHGMPPSFDGASDAVGSTPNGNMKHASVHAKDGNYSKNVSQAEGSGASKQTTNLGLFKTPRKEHNPMDVRAFFQQLREEDKETLQSYRNAAGRTFG